MATNVEVTFTHNIWTASTSLISGLQYEKYDTKGINFDLSSLHNLVTSYILVVSAFMDNNSPRAVTKDIDIGLAPYTTGQSTPVGGTSTTTIRTTLNLPAQQYGYMSFNFTYNTNASNQSSCWDKPFYICNYAILNANGQTMNQPMICQVIRKYTIPIPSAGESLSHAGLASFTTWCKMATASHTTTNAVISASESNRPWGTSATLIDNSGSSVTTSSTYAKTAGTSIQPSWVSAVISSCNNRSWTR